MNHCGTCTLCCKLRGVQELLKPMYQWCQYCDKTKCTVYEQRPQSCRDYVCLWLQMKQEGIEFPDKFKPENCKIVVDTAVTKFGEAFLVWLDEDIPGIRRRKTTVELIDLLIKVNKNAVIVCTKTVRNVVFVPPGSRRVLRELGLTIE